MAYDNVEPIGDRRLDLLFALLMAVTVNIHKSKDDKPAMAADFLPEFWTEERFEPEAQSLEEQRRMIQMIKLVFERQGVGSKE